MTLYYPSIATGEVPSLGKGLLSELEIKNVLFRLLCVNALSDKQTFAGSSCLQAGHFDLCFYDEIQNDFHVFEC